MIVTLFIALATYASMVFFTKYRTPIAVVGSGILLLYGTLSNTFPANLAFQRFPTEIVILIIVLALFTKIFENNGFFDYIGKKFLDISKGNKIIIAVLIPLTIYLISLFMNNLSAVLLFTFISLELSLKLKLPVAPILVSVIIGSNIGGAPLPWADTPAVVLTLYSDFNLFDFLSKLFVPCAIYTILLVLYTVWWCKREDKKHGIAIVSMEEVPELLEPEPNNYMLVEKPAPTLPHRKPAPPPPPHGKPSPPPPPPSHHGQLPPPPPPYEKQMQQTSTIENQVLLNKDSAINVQATQHTVDKPLSPCFDGIENLHWNPKKFSEVDYKSMGGYRGEKEPGKNGQSKWMKVWMPTIMFGLLILLICIAPFLKISIAYVSLTFIGLILIMVKLNPDEILNSLPIMDSVVFISALFLIAGALEYSGILKTAVDYIMTFTNGNRYLITLSIMLSAFIIATFLSAGPAAATLLPVCLQLSPVVGNRIVYAALALGILAGSSMLPWSATGGPVMLSEVNRFMRQRKISSDDKERIMKVFDLKHYLAFSIPFSFVILGLSAVFLCFYLLLM